MSINSFNLIVYIKITGVALCFLMLMSSNCKKEEDCWEPTNPECENYDPCWGVDKPTAAFIMEDLVGYLKDGTVPFVPEDSIFRGTRINFRSPYQGAEFKHTWYVGSEVLNDGQVSRLFRDVPRPATITIHHVLEYPVDSVCYPTDAGKDSVSQTFYLIESWNELATLGTFKVANENTTDSFEFKIHMLNPDGSQTKYGSLLEYESIFLNFNNSNDSIGVHMGYLPVNLLGVIEGASGYPSGRLIINDTSGEVIVEFALSGEQFIQKGRKIK